MAGWPPAGERDSEKAALLAGLRGALSQSKPLDALRLAVLRPPTLERRPQTLKAPHKGVPDRVDPYYWLRDDARTDRGVLAALAAENAHTDAVLADAAPVAAALAAEMRAAIQEADEGAPLLKRGFWWNWKTVEGGQHRVHTRRKAVACPGGAAATEADAPGEGDGPVEVVLDEDARAAKHAFYMASGLTVSPDGRLAAWGEDTEGGEKFVLLVKDLEAGQFVGEPIPETAGEYAFSVDGAAIFYSKKDALDRPHQIWRHDVARPAEGRGASEAGDGNGGDGASPAGTPRPATPALPTSTDTLVFQEDDPAFYVGVHRTRDDALILITSGSAITNEVLAIRAAHPTDAPVVILAREHDVEHDVASHRGWGALLVSRRTPAMPNSALIMLPIDATAPLRPLDPSDAITLVPHRADVKLDDFEVGRSLVALFERGADGLQSCTFFRVKSCPSRAIASLAPGHAVNFSDAAYELGAGPQGDWDSPVLRVAYSSLRTPPSTIDIHTRTHARAFKRTAPVGGGFDSSKYVTAREWAFSHYGVRVPVSLVYRADLVTPGVPAPLLLNGYGSYEVSNNASWRQGKLPLLDRGWVFAIAHVRGGGDCGRSWYTVRGGEGGGGGASFGGGRRPTPLVSSSRPPPPQDAKFEKKRNTFLDFNAVARHLVAEKWTDPSMLACEGRSAGGLLIGAALNEDPGLYAAAIAGVPFVDCLTTMLDETIPLTTIEFGEWGDPATSRAIYSAIAAYAPVDNVEPGAPYPPVLATCGLHDPRVGYWEVVKWIATLRDRAGASSRGAAVVRVELGAGHFSKSGRLERLLPAAEELAFLLKSVGMLHAPKR